MVEVTISKLENKQVKINSVKHPRISDLIGQFNAVVFSSEDIDIVKGEPSHRRRFLNLEISQTSPQYIFALGRYKRVLEQRNNLLREIKTGGRASDSLEAWDAQLAAYGATVMQRRAKFVEILRRIAAQTYARLTGDARRDSDKLSSKHRCIGCQTEQEVMQNFSHSPLQRRQVDFARGTSTLGPHRDDLQITLGRIPAREYGSQGQQRTAAIAIKLAEIDLMCESVGEAPVVLLDDVMAELDEIRRAHVLELTVGRCQTLITTTDLSELDKAASNSATVFNVISGTVTRK